MAMLVNAIAMRVITSERVRFAMRDIDFSPVECELMRYSVTFGLVKIAMFRLTRSRSSYAIQVQYENR
jgi:hypothetical protein